MFKKYLDSIQDTIINSTCEWIRIPSVYEPSKEPTYPFGKPIKDALDYILNLGKQLGFRTKNIDNYCGYIEFGEGEQMIGIIGHIDVVPASADWNYPPFCGIIENNKIYGRGAIDDKGPVIATLYAMKAIMETTCVSKRVRLILGTDEERTWKGISYYKEKEELPSVSFSPDADFPCIYAEKALLSVYLRHSYLPLEDSIQIEEVKDNNNAINVVPKTCQVKLKIDSSQIDMEEFLSELSSIIEKREYSIEIYHNEESIVELKSIGKAAHAAHPDQGINAISTLLVVLYEIFHKYHISNEFLEKFYQEIRDDSYGKNMKINTSDESGKLTLTVSKFFLENNKLGIGINLRIPITVVLHDIKNQFTEVFDDFDVNFEDEKPALYLPKDNSLITLLTSLFNEEAKTHLFPIAIGGATYARAFANCVSFGPNLPGNKDMCHQVDEFIGIENLLFCSQIYAKAIYELAK